jgi:hypothetical protein
MTRHLDPDECRQAFASALALMIRRHGTDGTKLELPIDELETTEGSGIHVEIDSIGETATFTLVERPNTQTN